MLAVAIAAALSLSHPTAPVPAASLRVRVDSARHVVVLTSGRYDLPAGHGDHHAAPGGMAGMSMTMSNLMRFTFPVDGWLRGVRLRITDPSGKLLSRRFIHHVNVINFGRRQLFYPVPELIVALGQETEDIHLPATVGVPVTSAMPMAMFIMFDNETPQDVKGVTVEMTIEYSPTNLVPRPLSVLPGYMDVVYPVGRDVDFDLPPGATTYTADFKLAVAGRIIGAAGELQQHDGQDAGERRHDPPRDAVRAGPARAVAQARRQQRRMEEGHRLSRGEDQRNGRHEGNEDGVTRNRRTTRSRAGRRPTASAMLALRDLPRKGD